MSEKFNLFLSQLSETNSTLEEFTDFEKIINNVNKISIKLNQLNYLIGKNDLHQAIKELFQENPSTFEVLEILIAVRKSERKKVLDFNNQVKFIEDYLSDYQGICNYINNTGLSEIFKSKRITNLVDYVFGVEVGLDTNARKNRGGKNMENAVAKVFKNAGIKFEKEVNSSNFKEIKSLGGDLKRFDFVIKTPIKTYLIETNFYNGGGSKLNEVARAYSDVAPKINQYQNYEFVWITDGHGWLSAKNKLKEAFSIIPNIYNLTSLKDFIKKIKELI